MHRPRRATLRVLLTGMALWAAAAQATVIYRWVDDQGRTHVSDVVPEPYRNSAVRIDSGQFEASPAQRQEAQERAAIDKARAAGAAERRAYAAASAPAPAAAASAATPAKRPAQGVTASTDCASWWQLYGESQACFGAYRNVRGGLKPEAFEHCNPIASPEPTCGPLRR